VSDEALFEVSSLSIQSCPRKELGDITTLADPSVVEVLKQNHP